MKYFLSIVFLFFSFSSFSQNVKKEYLETIDWLNDKIESYAFKSEHLLSEYQLSLEKKENQYFIKIYSSYTSFGSINTQTFSNIYHFPIEELHYWEFKPKGPEEFSKGYILFLYTENEKPKVIDEKLVKVFRPDGENRVESEFSRTDHCVIHFRNEIDNENLRERINNALNHIKELASKKKEKEKF
ncbi:hypothetical protein [Mangrovimonas futianensis]|uniref:hypothetical protein n=1 Tax=Mangrovimonas futianensis TaxID=2895523 RepID=UPI001E5C07B9|nr:hypothetical protein [Mangrovimonas futianensis]MCF1420437.1 hypothetical protein [Mangrovimonas futianensis]